MPFTTDDRAEYAPEDPHSAMKRRTLPLARQDDRDPGASPMARAFHHYDAAESRLVELLEVLGKELSDLTSRLEPVLHDGSPATFPEPGETRDDTDEVDVDTRALLVRTVDQQADRLGRHAMSVSRLIDRVRGITQAVEL